jgi:hypothetical protein
MLMVLAEIGAVMYVATLMTERSTSGWTQRSHVAT